MPIFNHSAQVAPECGHKIELPFSHVLYEVPQFGENQFFASKLAGLETSRHAEDHGLTYNAGRGPGKEGSRVDFPKAQLAKKGTKSSQFFGEHRSDRFNGYISRTDSRAPGNQDCMRAVFLNDRSDRIGDDVPIVRDHLVKNYFMLLLLSRLFHPVPAFVVGKSAGAGYSQNGKYKRLGSMGLMSFGTHGGYLPEFGVWNSPNPPAEHCQVIKSLRDSIGPFGLDNPQQRG